MADGGPTPRDLGNVSRYDTKTTQGDSGHEHMTCHAKTCAPSPGRRTRPAREQATTMGIVEKGADEWTSGRRDDGAKRGGKKKGSKGSKPDWHSDKDKGKGKRETQYCYDCGEQGHIGVNCPNKWANSIDEEDDQTSPWESEPEGRER